MNYLNISPSELGIIDRRPKKESEGFGRLTPVYSGGRISYFRYPSSAIRPRDHITQMGDYRHAQYQDKVSSWNIIPEYEISNQIFGDTKARIDIWHNGIFGIGAYPEEVKSIGFDAFSSMRGPKATAVSQLNAYMYATGTDTGQLTYIARESSMVQRTFNVAYNPGRLISDIAAQRQSKWFPMDQSLIYADNPINVHYMHRARYHGRNKRQSNFDPGYNKGAIYSQ